MADTELSEKRQFAEDFGILFERMGMQPMAGRIWGWLLAANPPRQTAAEIAGALSCSRSSVSTMTGALMHLGMIERVAMPGDRNRYYRVSSGGFTQMLRTEMALTASIRRMAERGLNIVAGDPPEARAALEEYRDCCAFFEREFPALIDQWERERKQR